MNESPVLAYKYWMSGVRQIHPTNDCVQLSNAILNITMSNNFKHCHVGLHDFPSSEVRFLHTSTLTRSHPCSKKYEYNLGASCFSIKLHCIITFLHYLYHGQHTHRSHMMTSHFVLSGLEQMW